MRTPFVLSLCLVLAGFANAEEKPLPKKGEKGIVPPKDQDWTRKLVVAKKPMKDIRFGDWVEGKAVYVTPIDLLHCHVIEDRDGFLRVHDSGADGTGTEGWVLKQDFLLLEFSVAHWAEVRQSKPKDPFSIFMHGLVDPARGDESVSDMTEAIRLDPKNSTFFFNRGYYWFKVRHDYGKALADFSEAIRISPKVACNFRFRGCAYIGLNEHKKAFDDLTEAIGLRPNYAGALCDRGGLWAIEGEFEKAMTDLNEAIRIDPNSYQAYTNRYGTWMELKSFDQARAEINECLRIDPKNANTIARRGAIHLEMKNYPEAFEDFDSALEIEPRNRIALTCKARAYASTGKYSEATVTFGEATAYSPSEFSFVSAALFYSTCPKDIYRDGKKALEYCEQAKKMGARGQTYWQPLAAAYAETGQFDLAVAEQTKVVEKLKSAKKPDADDVKKAEAILELYKSKKPYRDTGE